MPDLMLAHHNASPGHGNTLLMAEVAYVEYLGVPAVTISVEACQWLWQQQQQQQQQQVPQQQQQQIHVAQGAELKLPTTYRHIWPIAIHPESAANQPLPRLLTYPTEIQP